MNKIVSISSGSLIILATILLFAPIDSALTIATRVTIASFLIIAGVFFLVWLEMRKQDISALETLPASLEEIRKLGREYFKNTAAIQENSESVRKLHFDVLQQFDVLKKYNKLLDDILILQRQDTMVIKTDFHEWQKAVMRFYEYLYRSKNLEGLDDTKKELYEKISRDFLRELKPLGFDLIIPTSGEKFDENYHECTALISDGALSPGTIATVENLGFILDGRCFKAAPVKMVLAYNPALTDNSADEQTEDKHNDTNPEEAQDPTAHENERLP